MRNSFGLAILGLLSLLGPVDEAGARQAAAHGAELFSERCSLCPAIEGSGGGQGPSLAGVVGRKAAPQPSSTRLPFAR